MEKLPRMMSEAKTAPAMGALYAAEMPAAAPQPTSSRSRYGGHVASWPSLEASVADNCVMPPSRPMDAPVAMLTKAEAVFTDCRFTDVQFSATVFEGARFTGCRFVRCRFAHADLREAAFERCGFADPDARRGTDRARQDRVVIDVPGRDPRHQQDPETPRDRGPDPGRGLPDAAGEAQRIEARQTRRGFGYVVAAGPE